MTKSTIDQQTAYLPAYSTTNEDWRSARTITYGARRVLTVAGSGDQALTYRLAGAAHVDTYDITHCAHVIQDIKTTAIQILPRNEYIRLIQELHYSTNPFGLESMRQIIKHLPSATLAKIRKNPNNFRFYRGSDITSYPNNIFTDSEYKKLQTIVRKPFKFYLAPIEHLHTQLTGKYDLIDTSNIFDYGQTNIIDTLVSLIPHTKVGGRIIYMPQNINPDYTGLQITMHSGSRLEHERTLVKPHAVRMIILQRTR